METPPVATLPPAGAPLLPPTAEEPPERGVPPPLLKAPPEVAEPPTPLKPPVATVPPEAAPPVVALAPPVPEELGVLAEQAPSALTARATVKKARKLSIVVEVPHSKTPVTAG